MTTGHTIAALPKWELLLSNPTPFPYARSQ